MRDIEARSESAGVSTDTLMENAGLAVARIARRLASPLKGVPILALIGPANNGADGLVTARHLQRWGANVTAYICRDRPSLDPKLESARRAGVRIVSISTDPDLSELRYMLRSAHLAIDAILGAGRSRPIEGSLKAILAHIASARVASPNLHMLAVDLPTGVDCDGAGADPSSIFADTTVALGYPKRGHFAFPGADSVGRLEVVDIGIPPRLDEDIRISAMTAKRARATLPRRPADSHKGTFGRAMMVVGSRKFLGAAYLSASAAVRVGAGLVTIAIPESLIPSIASKAIEPTFLPLPESAPGVVGGDSAKIILDSLNGYGAILVGCGLGQERATVDMAENLLLTGHRLPPTVVDADGLNTLARRADWPSRWTSEAVLTPHPGEMSRLTDGFGANSNRIDASLKASAMWNKIIVLKGAHTITAYADGTAVVSPFANPALATAGTGDVLAGMITGLISQGIPMRDASTLGVYLHASAAETVRDNLGDAGMAASDLLIEIPRAIRRLRES